MVVPEVAVVLRGRHNTNNMTEDIGKETKEDLPVDAGEEVDEDNDDDDDVAEGESGGDAKKKRKKKKKKKH